jgi:predicted transposase YdaD
MAEIDPWGHNLRQEITAMMQADDLEIYKLSPTLRAAFEEGEREGEQKGAESERRELLSEAFAEQAGRPPTPDEQAALAKRAQEIGAKQALRALFKLHGDALVVWLLGRGA